MSEALGARIRELRGERTQDQLGKAARAWGLAWNRNVVAAIEAGRHDLSTSELLLLPAILRSIGIEVELPDLFAGPGRLTLTSSGTSIRRADVAGLLAGESPGASIRRQPWTIAGAFARGRDILNAVAKLLPDADVDILEDMEREEAVQKAGRSLDVPPVVIAAAARARYKGRSFTEERDRRASARVTPDMTRASVQAIRGRVSRELLDELASDIAAVWKIGKGKR